MIDPVNIVMAIKLIAGLSERIIAYRNTIVRAQAENRDITESELDALAEQAGQALELARARIEVVK